ncbi:uncharacterized protein LOC106880196 [Octopus bimaculoides]|uniref:Uncharacterized protein n=1 Tax=Octopus bimaculoides TaxID=37653 RepID=A0A0L8I8V5_OCTBM|nr:uncharacterized protein LOC106880196 [Octopus bimaculoides]|eukprot:XP_014785535.1 PREDICTED: uncharacterized protein LOC106880196 [Octopus bimaculoides]
MWETQKNNKKQPSPTKNSTLDTNSFPSLTAVSSGASQNTKSKSSKNKHNADGVVKLFQSSNSNDDILHWSESMLKNVSLSIDGRYFRFLFFFASLVIVWMICATFLFFSKQMKTFRFFGYH